MRVSAENAFFRIGLDRLLHLGFCESCYGLSKSSFTKLLSRFLESLRVIGSDCTEKARLDVCVLGNLVDRLSVLW